MGKKQFQSLKLVQIYKDAQKVPPDWKAENNVEIQLCL